MRKAKLYLAILLILFSLSICSTTKMDSNSHTKQISMKENHLYKLRLPHKKEVILNLELGATDGLVMLDVKSSGLFEICVLDENKTCLETMRKYNRK